ncbi:MAG TPA: polysaccharide biosynthesis/export family protein [Bacteroidia bacterium]|nr:polysaccharide biosynthesis/export family protein [Bacteroidia bacterium]
MKLLLYSFILLFILPSCKTQNFFVQKHKETRHAQLDSIFAYDPNYQYTIRHDDKISISVWGQDELSVGSVYGIYNSNEVYGKWLLVDVYGNIEVPKLGTINVINKTLPELKDTLKKTLQKWIVNPIIDIKVLNKEITLLGELKSPGAIKVDKDQNNLMEMISKAGGTEFYANIKKVKILRQEGVNVRVANIDLTKPDDYINRNIILHPGDIVIVPAKGYKEFDKRISTIIPFTTTISAAAIILGLF